MDEHLGYAKHAVEGRNQGNSRNGTRSKTVLTEIGPVDIEVPRDRDGSFDPQTVRKGQRRLGGRRLDGHLADAKGLTTGEIQAHLAEMYCDRRSPGRRSPKITDRGARGAWPSGRPGRWTGSTRWCSSTPSWSRSATARSPTGPSTWPSASTWTANATCLGMWVGHRRRGRQVLAAGAHRDQEPRRRRRLHRRAATGSRACPSRSGDLAPGRSCRPVCVHLVRNSLRYASKKHWAQMCRDLRADLHRRQRADAAEARFDEFADTWGDRYPAMIDTLGTSLGRVRAVPGVPRRAPHESSTRRMRLSTRARRVVWGCQWATITS